ncbi:GGDEF domain-containing protein [Entomohabitans teleogrylli]|uniref:GGDEF domain-containing protein n=1 Tax=Entomohabitans teleogrylli TaxID=1384589 RepID=UPI00073D7BDF|nr:GGDEF domain-containing protein [Entomohabitans teleogrylli]
MMAQTWRALLDEKSRLSSHLFILLNAISALFSIANPAPNTPRFTLPVTMILAASLLLGWQWINRARLMNNNITSLLFGLLWSWHIWLKNSMISDPGAAYLLIALLSILFIGAIAFINNVLAFCLHCLPPTLTIIWLDRGEHLLHILYSVALPTIGITIQYLIQKRNDAFALDLMNRLQQEKETLNDLSMLDPLTGLYNRRGLQNRLDNLHFDQPHHILLLDIDHFKAYNDHYGHAMGDQALIRVSSAIRNAVRSRDIVTRYGGEEFMIVLANTSIEHACQTAERIRQQIFELKIPHLFNDGVATSVTVSIGIAPLPTADVAPALAQADKALYAAKRMGRNHILTADQYDQSGMPS